MSFVSKADILAHIAHGPWRALEKLAATAVADAAQSAKAELTAVLGGGTRLMLALQHRISDDVDLFIRDPQWIGYLTPRLNDCLAGDIDDYDENQTSLKLVCTQGEIDFVVSMSLLGLPNDVSADSCFALEPVAEVLAKKLFYRGWALTPRDLFDWRLIEMHMPPQAVHAQDLAKLLTGRFDKIENALQTLSKAPVHQARWDSIRAPYAPDFQESIEWARARLQQLRQHQHSQPPDQTA